MLPYADDIRDLDQIIEAAGLKQAEEKASAPAIIDSLKQEEKNAAKLLIKNLTIDFDARNYDNPTIQKFYSGLQALALNEDEPEPVEDLLAPDYEEMARFQPVINKFKSVFFDGEDSEQDVAMASASAARGRGRGRGSRGAAQSGESSQAANGKPKSKRKAAAPINEAIFEDSDAEERNESKVSTKRRRLDVVKETQAS